MSGERIDTDAVRNQFFNGPTHWPASALDLCDEVDRLAGRVATLEAELREWDDVVEVWETDRTHAEVYYAVQGAMRARAALLGEQPDER